MEPVVYPSIQTDDSIHTQRGRTRTHTGYDLLLLTDDRSVLSILVPFGVEESLQPIGEPSEPFRVLRLCNDIE